MMRMVIIMKMVMTMIYDDDNWFSFYWQHEMDCRFFTVVLLRSGHSCEWDPGLNGFPPESSNKIKIAWHQTLIIDVVNEYIISYRYNINCAITKSLMHITPFFGKVNHACHRSLLRFNQFNIPCVVFAECLRWNRLSTAVCLCSYSDCDLSLLGSAVDGPTDHRHLGICLPLQQRKAYKSSWRNPVIFKSGREHGTIHQHEREKTGKLC